LATEEVADLVSDVTERNHDRLTGSSVPMGLGWLCAVVLFAASVMTLLLSYDITAPAPTQVTGPPNLLRSTVLFFANERERWTQEVIAGCLFAAGFVLLAAVAVFLSRRRGIPDVSASLMVVALAIGAALGVGSALFSLGAEQAAIDPHLCDCKYSAMQLIARGGALDVANSAGDWLLYGFFALAAVAFSVAAVSEIGSDMGRGWRYLAGAIAALFVIGLVASVVGASDLYDIIVGIGGGILLPLWAIWTGQKVGNFLADRGAVASV
jgi:hypothetical protein